MEHWNSKSRPPQRPYTLFLLILTLLCFLILLTLSIFPSTGLRLGNQMTLQLPSLAKFFGISEEAEVLDLSDIEELDYVPSHSLLLNNGKDLREQIYSLPLVEIEHSTGEGKNLSQFFETLRLKQKVRILYFGDSQIERDRITFGLRNKLRQYFEQPGQSIGLFPLNPKLAIHPNIKISLSSEWETTSPIVKLSDDEARQIYGVCLALTSTILHPTNARSVTLTTRNYKIMRPFAYDAILLQCRNTEGKTTITLRQGKKVIQTITMNPAKHMQLLKFSVPHSMKSSYQFEFLGEGILEISAVSLEDKSKIMVDNIALRSNDGLDFSRVSQRLFAQSLLQINPSLIIYQFGLNYIAREDTLERYQQKMAKQLSFLRKALPKVDILVVGINDYANFSHGSYITPEHIDRYRYIQRKTALQNHCAYWDLYTAMGAKKSALYWAKARPALLTKDYCHFTPTGIEVIEELLFNAIIQDYIRWKDES